VSETNVAAYRERVREMGHRISSLERLIKLSQVINSTLELAPLLDMIIQIATELTDTASASIMLVDKETRELRFAAVTGQKSASVRPFPVPLEGSIAGTVAAENRPLLIRDARSDPRWYQEVDKATGFVTQSIMAVPMQVRGQVIGVLEALNKRGEAEMTWEDVQILTTLANQAAIAVENARLVAELHSAYNELNELDRMKTDFISIAAHELRTPLSVILGYAMFLKDDASGKMKEQLDIVLQSAMHLRSLIDDMLNLRQVDQGQATLELETFSIQDLVLSVVDEIRSIAEAKGLQLALSVPDEPLMIEADRSKLNIVLVNLLSNAIKFTDTGGRIGVRAGGDNDAAWFAVWDTGIGIPLESQHRIFDRFYQVEPSLARHYEGMGLGLSIAREMVQLHQGHIKVDSVPGQGSAFTVTLPLALPR
jgi:signal transduction histidine kinase